MEGNDAFVINSENDVDCISDDDEAENCVDNKEVDRVIDSSSFGITRHGDEMYSGYCIDSTVYRYRCVQWHTRFGWNIMVLSVAYSHKVYC